MKNSISDRILFKAVVMMKENALIIELSSMSNNENKRMLLIHVRSVSCNWFTSLCEIECICNIHSPEEYFSQD